MKNIIVYTTVYHKNFIKVEDDVYEDEDKLQEKAREIANKIAGNNDYDYEYELDEKEE